MSDTERSWLETYEALAARITADPQFPEVVRCYGGDPMAHAPTRRASRLASRICERLGLNPAIYRGNVFGAAADRIAQRVP